MTGAPRIEGQVRRDIVSGGEPADFGSVRWLERVGDPAGAEMTAGIARWDSGKGNAEHLHPNCEELLFVLEGEVEHTLGEQRTTLRKDDLIVIPRNTAHRVFNASPNAATTFIVFSSPDRQFVALSS